MQALDGTDNRLLPALAQDPRKTVVALARKLGRTNTALAMGELIPFRVQPLLDRGSGHS